MKATIEIPDELYRRIKAKSALDGRTVRDVTVQLFRQKKDQGHPPQSRREVSLDSVAYERWPWR